MSRQAKTDDPRFLRSRQALLDAAYRLVSRARPEGLSVKALCEEAGVTRPTFYQHFQSVEGAAQSAALARLVHHLPQERALPAAQVSPDAIAARAMPILEHLSDDRVFYRNVAEGAGSVEFFDGLVALVEGRVLAGGVLDAMPDRAALVAGGVTWLVIRWLRSTDEDCAALAARIGATIGPVARA